MFYSELTHTEPWCNMLRDFTWTEKYEEAMSDEPPLWHYENRSLRTEEKSVVCGSAHINYSAHINSLK